MNTTDTNENLTVETTFADRCVQSCKKLLAEIDQTRHRIAYEFHETLEANERLVQLALNEAEALAWQTAYPHLIFPTLATEKVQAVAAWQNRQKSLWRKNSIFAEAA